MCTTNRLDWFCGKVARRLLAGLLAQSAGLIFATNLPVEETFDDEIADGFYVAGTAGAYEIVSDSEGYAYRASLSKSTGHASASAGLLLDNAADTAFIVSTKLVISSLTAPGTSGINAGLGLYSSTVDFNASGQYRLLYQFTQGNAGKLQILRNGTAAAISTAVLPPRLNVPYILQAIITHESGEVTIKGLLSDDADTITVTFTDPAPLPGAYFGYRTALNAVGGTASVVVKYDDFDVVTTIPPPQAGDQSVTGSLSVGGIMDVTGNSITFGSQDGTYAAGLLYDDEYGELTFDLTHPDGSAGDLLQENLLNTANE
jgi:hypothetical protein